MIAKFYLLTMLCVLFTGSLNAQISTESEGHPCGVMWPTLQVSIKTTTLLGNQVELQTPASIIKSYVVHKIKKEAVEAAAKRSLLVTQLRAAAATGKKYATYVNLIAEGFSTAGLIIDEVDMNATFYCCDKSSMDNANVNRPNLFISLRSEEQVTKTPTIYASAMVDLATQIVRRCPGQVVRLCSECE